MKKLLKMMASASVFAVISMPASATVTSYTTVITGWLTFYGTLFPPHPVNGAHFNGAGAASYNDTTNVLTYSHSITFDMSFGIGFPLGPSVGEPLNPAHPAIATWTQSGTMNLAAGTGVNTASGCFDNPNNYLAFCTASNNADGVPIPWTYVTANSPSINYGWESYPYGPMFGHITAFNMTFLYLSEEPRFFTAPIPAAAWLFGSALLGLASCVGRNKRRALRRIAVS